MKATKVPLSHGGHLLHGQLPPCLLLSLGCQAIHGSNLAFASCLLPLEWQGSASLLSGLGGQSLRAWKSKALDSFFIHRPESREKWGKLLFVPWLPAYTRFRASRDRP